MKQVAAFCKSAGQESSVALRSVFAGLCVGGAFVIGVEGRCEAGVTPSMGPQAASRQHRSRKRRACNTLLL